MKTKPLFLLLFGATAVVGAVASSVATAVALDVTGAVTAMSSNESNIGTIGTGALAFIFLVAAVNWLKRLSK